MFRWARLSVKARRQSQAQRHPDGLQGHALPTRTGVAGIGSVAHPLQQLEGLLSCLRREEKVTRMARAARRYQRTNAYYVNRPLTFSYAI